MLPTESDSKRFTASSAFAFLVKTESEYEPASIGASNAQGVAGEGGILTIRASGRSFSSTLGRKDVTNYLGFDHQEASKTMR